MNFVKGVIDADQITVGSIRFPNPSRLSGNVTVAVRPEDIILDQAGGSGLPGTVKQIMILGHYAEVSVDVQGYGTIRAFQARDQINELSNGQSVSVQFAKVIAYP